MVKEEPNFSTKSTIQHYLSTIKKIINLIKLHKRAGLEKDTEKMAFIECKLKQMNCQSICQQVKRKHYKALIHIYTSQIKVINYISKEGFISLKIENVGLSSRQVSKTCMILAKKGLLRRNCTGLAYEFNN